MREFEFWLGNQKIDLLNYQFTIDIRESPELRHKIGDITIGGFNGQMDYRDDGIHLYHQDGTKHFISNSWFDYKPEIIEIELP